MLKARVQIKADKTICEYVGLIHTVETVIALKEHVNLDYTFELNLSTNIDSFVFCNEARFANDAEYKDKWKNKGKNNVRLLKEKDQLFFVTDRLIKMWEEI